MKPSLKILHLEDLPSDALLIRKVLKKGFPESDILVVDTKEKYIKALHDFSPHIILADHSLPTFNSHEALEIKEALALDVPFILLTAAMSDEFAVDILKKGADDYIIKDRLQRLSTAILNVLEKYRLKIERQNYIDELENKEKRYRLLIENGADAVAILDEAGKPTYVSPSIKPVLGYSEEEILQLNLMDILHPEDQETIAKRMAECLLKPAVPIVGTQARIKHKNGDWRWMEGTLTNMLHEPTINGIVDNFRDITERKLAEQAIVESEIKYRSFFENSMDAILLTIPDGDILAANPAACAMFQMSEEELCQAGRTGIVDTTDPRLIPTLAERRKNSIAKAELTFIRKDGSRFPAEVSSSIFKDGYGEERASIIMRDVTERKKAEEQLRKSEIFNKEVLASLSAHIAVIDTTGKIIAVNKAWEDFSEQNNGDLFESTGTNSNYLEICQKAAAGGDLIAAQTLAGILAVFRQEKSSFELEYPCHSPQEQRWFILQARNFDSDKSKIVIAHQNITDRKKAEQAFNNERERYLDLFLHAPFSVGIIKGPDFTYEKVNDHYLNLSGRKNINGKTVKEVFPEVEHQGLIDLLTYVYTTGKTFSANEHLIKIYKSDDGVLHNFYLNFTYQAYRNKENQIEGIFFFAIDVTEQVQSRQKIEKSEKQYRQIVETAQEGIWLIDENRLTTFVNRKMAEILEYTEEEMLGKDIFAFMDEEGRQKSKVAMERRKAGIPGQSDFKYMSKSGKEVWTRVSANSIFDEKGKFTGALAMVSDISEQKKLAELLKEATQLAHIGSYESDLINEKHYWSPMMREIYEVDEEFIPNSEIKLGFFQAGANRQMMTLALQEAVINNVPYDMELQIVTAKGNKKWVRDIGKAEFKEGKCVRVYGSFQDIDKTKKAELDVLKAFEEKIIILESIGDGFFAVDTNWKITYWNKIAEKLLRIPKKQAYNKNFRELFRNIENSNFYENHKKALETNQVVHYEDYYTPYNIWIEVSIYPSATGLSVFFKDITERKLSALKMQELNQNLQKYTKELMASNKGLEQFSYIVSHNLRAPVANIIGLAGIIDKPGSPPEVKKKCFEGMQSNAQRLDSVIMDLHKILQVKKEIAEKKENVNLAQLVYDIEASIEDLMQKESVQINVDFKAAPEIFTLKSYLHSIFYNLISNSIKYRRSDLPPVIQIKSEIIGNELIICFKDNGLGINLDKNKDQVFGLYKRFHLHIEGKGMGLFMVKTQVQTLGGDISINSQINNGTEFKIKFKHY